MVFPSFPLYVDPPNSWNQPQAAAAAASTTTTDDNQPRPPTGSAAPCPTRPVSMAERARLAKIPQPEAPLSCPRCNSNNTKFCYFNNYSLSQPRHFCKTCRRYWTRGGTLRNVPVGGGCRRNKRSGKSSSLTSATSPKLQQSKSSTSTTATSVLPTNLVLLPAAPPLSLLTAASWNQLQEYGYAGQSLEQWRLPYLGGIETTSEMQVATPAVPAMYGYHEGEWSVGRSINGNGAAGWMSNSISNHVLGFGNSSSTGNGNPSYMSDDGDN